MLLQCPNTQPHISLPNPNRVARFFHNVHISFSIGIRSLCNYHDHIMVHTIRLMAFPFHSISVANAWGDISGLFIPFCLSINLVWGNMERFHIQHIRQYFHQYRIYNQPFTHRLVMSNEKRLFKRKLSHHHHHLRFRLRVLHLPRRVPSLAIRDIFRMYTKESYPCRKRSPKHFQNI